MRDVRVRLAFFANETSYLATHGEAMQYTFQLYLQ